MDSRISTTTTTTTISLAVRGGFLLVLVVFFQWFVARAPGTKQETKRRFQHALTGHALVQISHVLPPSLSLVLLVFGAAGMWVAKTFFFEKFLRAFGGLLRPSELSGDVLPGAFYFLVGTALTVSGWVTDDLRIARYAVECLALADPMASWIGSSVRSPKLYRIGLRTSSLAGCLACFGTALAVGWWMLVMPMMATKEKDGGGFASHSISNNHGDANANTAAAAAAASSDSYEFTTVAIVAGALACTIAEGLPFGNDNLNIPVITAFVMDRVASSSSSSSSTLTFGR